MLRASSFTLAGERLPEGAAKAGILRAIASAKPFLTLAVILRITRFRPGRYHRWNRASTAVCGLADRSSCPRTDQAKGAAGTLALRASGSLCLADLHATLFAFTAAGEVKTARPDIDGVEVTGLPAGLCK